MDRSPALLAALASAAVPGLDPVSVEALPSTPDQAFDVGFVRDHDGRRWVVRAPRTEVAGADILAYDLCLHDSQPATLGGVDSALVFLFSQVEPTMQRVCCIQI